MFVREGDQVETDRLTRSERRLDQSVAVRRKESIDENLSLGKAKYEAALAEGEDADLPIADR